MTKTYFGTTKDNQEIYDFTMTGPSGLEIHVLNYGATIQQLLVPRSDGSRVDVVLGFDNLRQYEGGHPYFGSIIGRNANRIGGGKISIDGTEFELAANEAEIQLHGGTAGFDKKVWDYEVMGESLRLTYTSPDGEEGFPGTVKVEALFELNGDNTLKVTHRATTNKPTIVNLTRHEYFNLAQGEAENILDHKLQINANTYLPKNTAKLPTGEIVPVRGTVMDLRELSTLREKIGQLDSGYDHNYVLNERGGDVPATILISPEGRLKMEVFCTQPGLQFYSAQDNGDWMGKHGPIPSHAPALCLEPQHFPDTPHNPHFPSTVLRPGEVYEQEIKYRFGPVEN